MASGFLPAKENSNSILRSKGRIDAFTGQDRGCGNYLTYAIQHVHHSLLMKLMYLRAKIDVAASWQTMRHTRVCRTDCSDADVVRLARPEGEVSR